MFLQELSENTKARAPLLSYVNAPLGVCFVDIVEKWELKDTATARAPAATNSGF